jgi:hypothetical protein
MRHGRPSVADDFDYDAPPGGPKLMPRRKQITLSLPPDLIEDIDADRARDIWPPDFARQRWIELACKEALLLWSPEPDEPSPQSADRPAGESSDGRNGGRDPDRAGTSPEAAGKTTSTDMVICEECAAFFRETGIRRFCGKVLPIRTTDTTVQIVCGETPESAIAKTNSTESGGRLHGVSPPLDGPVSQGETPKSASSPTPSEDVPNREVWIAQRSAELGLFMPQGAAAEQAASEYDETYGEAQF